MRQDPTSRLVTAPTALDLESAPGIAAPYGWTPACTGPKKRTLDECEWRPDEPLP